jgi:hypothetical protein
MGEAVASEITGSPVIASASLLNPPQHPDVRLNIRYQRLLGGRYVVCCTAPTLRRSREVEEEGGRVA